MDPANTANNDDTLVTMGNSLYRSLDPSNPAVTTALAAISDSALAYSFSPHGGEKHGAFSIASVSRNSTDDLLTAIVSAWKVELCMSEEWPYELWDAEGCQAVVRNFYQEEWRGWNEVDTAPTKFAATFLEQCDQVRAAMPPFSNKPQFYPNESEVNAAGLTSLLFATAPLLIPLANKWNSELGVFLYESRVYLAQWWTNA